MKLSGGYAVEPEQSTVAIIAHHPQAVYFGMKSGFVPDGQGPDELIAGTERGGELPPDERPRPTTARSPPRSTSRATRRLRRPRDCVAQARVLEVAGELEQELGESVGHLDLGAVPAVGDDLDVGVVDRPQDPLGAVVKTIRSRSPQTSSSGQSIRLQLERIVELRTAACAVSSTPMLCAKRADVAGEGRDVLGVGGSGGR